MEENSQVGGIQKGWFTEADGLWPGKAMTLKVDRVLYEGRSEFQQIRVFENSGCGRVLTLDNIIQLTEHDECAYQEMLAHVPLFAHDDPKRVLVIGGGDGGIVREVVRHAGVESVELCEIDEEVIRVSREFLPFTASGLDDPRVAIRVEDGAKWVADHPKTYDCIIVDSSDPIGPAEVLFQEKFYRDLRGALRPGGVIATQAECVWLHRDIIVPLVQNARKLFDRADYCWTSVPTYPSGTIGLLVASLGADVTQPRRKPTAAMQEALRYYNPHIHQAAFCLPEFARRWFV